MSDDDWETDPDFTNDLTEKQQRAFGNKETMQKYNDVMDKSGGSIPGEAPKITLAPKASPASTQPVDLSDGLLPVQKPAPAPAPTPPISSPPPAPPPVASPPQRTPSAGTPPSLGRTATPGKLQIPTTLQPASGGSGSGSGASLQPPAPLNSAHGSQRGLGSARGAVHNRTRRVSDLGSRKLQEVFQSFDTDGSGSIERRELEGAMTKLGMPCDAEKIEAMLRDVDLDGNGRVTFSEFVGFIERTKARGQQGGSSLFEEVVTQQGAAVMQQRKDNIVHSFAADECSALTDFINSKLSFDPQLAYLLPIKQVTDLFSACGDGVLLCRLVNLAESDTVDERVINLAPPNRFLVTENINLALNAAKSIGLTVINIGPSDIIEARPHLVLGLVWQLVKKALLSKINLKANPNLIRLLAEGETLETLLKLPPEKLLLRWFNYHLEQAGLGQRVANFGADLKDSALYCHLLAAIDPNRKASTAILSRTSDLHERAAYVASEGQRLGAEFNVQPADIVGANEKLNLGFVAALFNACPGLEPPDETQAQTLLEELPDENEGDSREERAFRMWVNSLGLDEAHFCTNLFEDVSNGVLLLHVMEHVRPGVVAFSRVNAQPKSVFKRIENLNYAVSLALGPFGYSLVGVQGKDLADGNKKLTLALVWQLMRTHLVQFLAALRSKGSGSDEQMVSWANEQVAASGAATKMRDFADKSLGSGLFLIDLLAAVEPRAVDRNLVTAGASEDEQKLNAKYAISCARKLGCSLFCTWEDIVDVKPKMVLSYVATLMSVFFAKGGASPRA